MILLSIITIIAIGISIYCVNNKMQYDKELELQTEQLQKKRDELAYSIEEKNLTLSELKTEISDKQYDSKLLQESITKSKNYLSDLKQDAEESLEMKKSLSEQAFSHYIEVLDKKYNESTKEYDELNKKLEETYNNHQQVLMAETKKKIADAETALSSITLELEKMKATRSAAIEAAVREQKIKDDLSFYCLQISDKDKADIIKLNGLKPSLNNPRILSMLIWSSYIQKPLKALITKIYGTENICGIYKITDQTTGMVYIGQSVNAQDRAMQHGKCGCDIDRPQGNKLYAAMVDKGIWNFSFEILEQCPRELLDEKEKFYIDLYDSKNNGFNSQIGNH